MQCVQDNRNARPAGRYRAIVVDKVIVGMQNLYPVAPEMIPELSQSSEVKSWGLIERHNFHAGIGQDTYINRILTNVAQTDHLNQMAATALA